MYNLIAGYNTMSKEEKANYDVKSVAILMSNVLFTMAFILIVGQAVEWWFNYPKFEIFFIIVTVLVGITYLLIKNKSKKFKI